MKIKLGFTLAEGATHAGIAVNKIRSGFTLAEVLITLTIIGAVAALTIPELVKNMNDYAYGKSKDTFDMKITEAMNQMKTNNEMDGYATSEKFVDVFTKYMKISKRCTAANLTDCFPAQLYATNGKLVDTMAKLKTGADFGKSTYTSPLSAVQFSNGTSALISYDPDCVAADAFSNQATATGCLSMVYDVNGFSKPNTAGKDIRLFNVDKLGPACAFELGGTCFGAPFVATPATWAECFAMKGGPSGIIGCGVNPDDFAGAVNQCGDAAHMPTAAQLAAITNEILGTTTCSLNQCWGSFSAAKSTALGFPASGNFYIWGKEYPTNVTFTYGAWILNASDNSAVPNWTVSRGSSASNIYTVCVLD